jgi:hypothetical protein
MRTLKTSLVAGLVVLVVAANGGQGPVDLGHRIGLDALVASTVHFYRFAASGLSSNELVLERVVALAGLTGEINSVASIRASFDVGGYWGGPALDMYANFAWPSGLELRAGQFLLPLGMDAMTEFGHQKMVSNSFLSAYVKPAGGRDIGVMGTWGRRSFSAAAAVVNGAGANAGDNNARKDLCGRVTARPFQGIGLVLALHGYYGWPDTPDSTWRTLGAELAFEAGPSQVQVEFQDQRYLSTRSLTAYAQFAYAAKLFEPCARLDLVMLRGQRPDLMLTAGANLLPVGDNVKVMLDGFYRQNYQDNWSVFGFILRLQAAL